MLREDGELVLRTQMLDGTEYLLPLPQGKVETILRGILIRQRSEPRVGTSAGATAFAMKALLEAMGQSMTITKVRENARGPITTKLIPEDLGI